MKRFTLLAAGFLLVAPPLFAGGHDFDAISDVAAPAPTNSLTPAAQSTVTSGKPANVATAANPSQPSGTTAALDDPEGVAAQAPAASPVTPQQPAPLPQQTGGRQSAPQVVAQQQLPAMLPSTQQNQVAMAQRQEAATLYQGGDVQGARLAIAKALEAAPQDPQLQALDQMMTQHVQNPWVGRKLKDQTDLLMAQAQRQDPGGVQEAGVIAFGASGPARPPVFTQLPNAAEAELLRQTKAQFDMKDFTGAERALTLRLEKDPGNWRLWSLRAAAKRGARDPQGAVDDATRALALNPADAWALKVRAYSNEDLGRFPQGLSDANQALSLNKADADAFAARSRAEEGLGQDAQSLADLRQAAALDPQFEALYRGALSSRGLPDPRPRRFPVGQAAEAAGGLGLLALGAALFWKKNTGLTTRRPMRAADRFAAEGEEPRGPKGFEIVRAVGQGGMGVVYEALDVSLHRRVALKRMRSEIAAQPRERRRFMKEARTVASLKHPNIIEIHSVVEEGDDLFLIFEYLAGETLDRILAGRKRLPASEALARAREIAKALDYAHGQGVVHQDLKPANVIVSEFGAKVMDFGIARRVQETLSTMSRGEVAGTPAYMAPEQERGEFLKESDIYALGVCLYEMLAGAGPFAGGSYIQKVERKFVALSSAAPHLPQAVDGVIEKALEPDPSRRYRAASQLVDDMSAALGAALPS